MPADVRCPRCQEITRLPQLILGEEGEGQFQCGNCRLGFTYDFTRYDPRAADEVLAHAPEFKTPGYSLLGMMARGGMGIVYSAVRDSDKLMVALKALPPEYAAHNELVQRFFREARLMASLNHPNVMKIADRASVEDGHYIVMPFMPGKTLKERIRQGAPLPLREIVSFLIPITEGLQHIHANGLVHRDLKPSNVILSMLGDVLVTDFGVAGLKTELGDDTREGTRMGTPQYIAPEQLRNGSEVTSRADQYSLAVLTYEMLTGSLPLGVFEPPSNFSREITPQAEAALLRALSYDPKKRFDSVREFARVFRASLPYPSQSLEEIKQVVVTVASALGDQYSPDFSDSLYGQGSTATNPLRDLVDLELAPAGAPQAKKEKPEAPAPPKRPPPTARSKIVGPDPSTGAEFDTVPGENLMTALEARGQQRKRETRKNNVAVEFAIYALIAIAALSTLYWLFT